MRGADDRIIEIDGTRRGAPVRILGIALGGLAIGAIFGSTPLLAAAADLPEGAIGDALHDAAAAWHQRMTALGATEPYDALRAALRRFEAARFGD